METRPPRSDKKTKLTVRASARQKEIIARAARIQQTTISEFVLENAFRAAHQVISDQAHFALPEKKWKAFCKALDAPPKSIPALRKLLREPSVFDE
ncbi:MAG TPA: DUF1778 domain-containing protein [Blastocatellia bacterium]|jgi:uncharacterized protein (DUF1778 family)